MLLESTSLELVPAHFMANTRKKSKRITKKEATARLARKRDIIAVVMLGLGLLHILALISYTPNDIPPKLPFNVTTDYNSPPHNFIGILGAIIAGVSYWIFGAAAYLLPVGLIWFGAGKFAFDATLSKRSILGFGLMLLAACCLLSYQNWFFQDWPSRYQIVGAGGALGSSWCAASERGRIDRCVYCDVSRVLHQHCHGHRFPPAALRAALPRCRY